MDGSSEIEITVHPSLAGIGAEEWDACAAPEAADGGRPARSIHHASVS